ncbi:uncharacterized protein LOC118478820 [Aplysia californica]|uniref:Uncharacterized protein LOC118478820 n=1 Tax=Aplysia californica TaxID=6500 RepID=A0ABM1W2X1_APLCA|nr:uncharacterized protein LOC118478820 [Aplysia californica]
MYKHFCNCLVWLCCPSHFKKSKNKPKVKASKTGSKVKAGHSKRSRSNKEAVTDYEESRQALRAKHSSSDCPDVEKGGVTEVTEVTGVTGVTEVGGSDLGSSRPHKPGRASSPQKAGTPPKSFPTHEKPRSPTDQSPDDDATTTTPPPPTTQPKKPGQEEIRVPMFVSLLIIALYIFGGAVLFSQWEKDWDYLIGSYFCFITLSTIGFGDYVFGVGGDLANNEKMIICALYLVLGLSIIAMCFNLMQEEVRAKFRWLGLKVGIIEHNDNKGP